MDYGCLNKKLIFYLNINIVEYFFCILLTGNNLNVVLKDLIEIIFWFEDVKTVAM